MTTQPVSFLHLSAKDSVPQLRCAPPATPPPFSSTTLVLKQVDPQRLGELGRAALTLFSSFWQEWERTKEEIAKKTEQELRASLGRRSWDVEASTSADRRFSGDGHLARGRYYSVCHEANGFDGGTMVRELTAYHDPLSSGILDIHDVQDEMKTDSDPSRSRDNDPPLYLLQIPGFSRDLHPWLTPFNQGHDTVQVVLEAAVTEARFERLIDLRIPTVAEWFTQNLTRLRWLSRDGEKTAAFPNKPPLDRFVDLLPSLLTQSLGGGGASSLIAGQWLRCLGADGLVFPSARSDASLTITGDRVEQFRGWNLIDFRDSPTIQISSFDLTAGWIRHVAAEVDHAPHPIYSGVSVGEVTSPGHVGSWSVRGLELCNAAFRTFRSALSLYRWAVGGGLAPATQRALTRGLAGSGSAESLMEHSGAFIRALFGDDEHRRWLVDAFANLSPEDRTHVDLSAAFRGMDRKLTTSRHRQT